MKICSKVVPRAERTEQVEQPQSNKISVRVGKERSRMRFGDQKFLR